MSCPYESAILICLVYKGSKQAIQSGLIDHRAGEERVPIAAPGDHHVVEPGLPASAEPACDPDLVDRGMPVV